MHVDPMSRTRRRVRLTLSWLATGSAVLLLTPVPVHTQALGWSPLIWLVLAPAALALILEPRLPARLMQTWRRRRRPHGAVPVRQKVHHRQRA